MDDVKRMAAWANTYWNDPSLLVSTVTSNIMMNYMQIMGDGMKIVGDITNGNYEDAGKTYGEILILTVGKLPTEVPENMTLF